VDTLGWRIYYGNGAVIDSRTTAWEDCPDDDVQVIVQFFDPPYRNLYSGNDYFWQWGQGMTSPGTPDVKLGKLMEDDAFAAIYATAWEDTTF